MSYKIGSFNMHNIGVAALSDKNARNLKTISKIIKKEGFDVIALQEVLGEGKAFISPDYAKKSIINELGGENEWGFAWADADNGANYYNDSGTPPKSDPRGEGYAFIWNKRKLRLCTTKVMTPYGEVERTFYPRMLNGKEVKDNMFRKPYFGRFTAEGMPGGTNVEFRLICVHTFYGKTDSLEERQIRKHELDVLLKDIYPQINDKRYGDPMDSYTIIMGDYNAEVWTKESRIWQEKLKLERGGKKPAVMDTDEDGVVISSKHNDRRIKTVQTELTTLKSKQTETGSEEFDTEGYSFNYDHFSYEEESFRDAKVHSRRLTSAVTQHCKIEGGEEYSNSFEKYYKTVSDHLPVVLEIEL